MRTSLNVPSKHWTKCISVKSWASVATIATRHENPLLKKTLKILTANCLNSEHNYNTKVKYFSIHEKPLSKENDRQISAHQVSMLFAFYKKMILAANRHDIYYSNCTYVCCMVCIIKLEWDFYCVKLDKSLLFRIRDHIHIIIENGIGLVLKRVSLRTVYN